MSALTPPRVVSLLPAATEFVCALGHSGDLVGRSHACDHPAPVRALPVVTATRVDPAASGRDIDGQVRKTWAAGDGLYRIDAGLLRDLRPDVVISQGQCEVCAVSGEELERALDGWPGPRPRIVTLEARRFADLWKDFARVAEALGIEDGGREVIAPYKERVAGIAARVAMEVEDRPSVLALEWFVPPMSAGNWIPEMIELAGGRPLLAKAGSHSPWIEWTSVRGADPEVLVLMPCGFGLGRTVEEAVRLRELPGWQALRSVRGRRVFACDGDALFNRPGPRLVDSLEALAAMLHPRLFDPKGRGTLWKPA